MKPKSKAKPPQVPNTFYYGHRLCHKTSRFKDLGETFFTYRYWNRKKVWIYGIISLNDYKNLLAAGKITIKRNKKLYPNTKIL